MADGDSVSLEWAGTKFLSSLAIWTLAVAANQSTAGPDRDSDDCDSLEPLVRDDDQPVIEVSSHQVDPQDKQGPEDEWVEISVKPATECVSVIGAEEGETPVSIEVLEIHSEVASENKCSPRPIGEQVAVVTEQDSLDSLEIDAVDSLDGKSDSGVDEKPCFSQHHPHEHSAFSAPVGCGQEDSPPPAEHTENSCDDLQRRIPDGGRISDSTSSSRTLKSDASAVAELLRTLDVECEILIEPNVKSNSHSPDNSDCKDTIKQSDQETSDSDVDEELCVAESKVDVETQYQFKPFVNEPGLLEKEGLSEEAIASLIVEEAPITKTEKEPIIEDEKVPIIGEEEVTPHSVKLEESQPESCLSVHTGGQLESCPTSHTAELPTEVNHTVDAEIMDASLALGSEASNMHLPPSQFTKDPAGLPNYLTNVTTNGNDADNASVHSDQSKGSLGERQRNTITEMYKETIERLRIDGEFKPISGLAGSRRSVNSSEMELSSYWNGGSQGNLNHTQDSLETHLKSSGYRGHGSADQINHVGSQQTSKNNSSNNMERSRSIDRMLDFKKGSTPSSAPKNYNSSDSKYGHVDYKSSDYSRMNGTRDSHQESSHYKPSSNAYPSSSILKNSVPQEPQPPAMNGAPFKFRNFQSGHNKHGENPPVGSQADYSEPVSKPAFSSDHLELPVSVAPAIRTALITSRTAPLTHAANSSGSRAHGPLAPNSKEMYRIQDLEDSVTSLKRLLNDREREIDELKAHQRGLQAEMHQIRAVGSSSEDKQKDSRLSALATERDILQAEVQKLKDALDQTRTGSGTISVSGVKGHTPPLDDYSPNNPLVLQRKIGELECQLADVQEASDTAVLRLEEAEKELSLLREEKRMSGSGTSASALQRENAKLREMLSAGGSGSAVIDSSYLATEVAQLRQDLRVLRDKNHQLTQDNIKLTEFIRDVENKPRDYLMHDLDTKPRDNFTHDLESKSRDIDSKTRESTSRFSTKVTSSQVSRSRSYDFLKSESVEETHAARTSAGVSLGNLENSFESRHSDRESRSRYHSDGGNSSTLQNGDARAGDRFSSERYSSRAARGRAEYADVIRSQMSRHRGPERTTSAIRFSSEGNRAHPGTSYKSFVEDLVDEPRFSSTLRTSTYTAPTSRGSTLNSLNLKSTTTLKRDESPSDSQNFSEFTNWEQVEKYKTMKSSDIDLPEPNDPKERRKSGGSDSTSSLLNELTQQLGLQESQEVAMAAPVMNSTPPKRYEPATITGPQMSLPLSPPSSPDPLQDTGSRWSKMGRPLEPKPMPTQHNKHLLDNAISSHSSASNFNTNGKVPFAARNSSDVTVGDVVKFCRQGGKISRGVVKYIGHLPSKNDIYLGVELEHEMGKHDGTYEGHRYFSCPPNRGVFVAFSKVVMVWGMSQ